MTIRAGTRPLEEVVQHNCAWKGGVDGNKQKQSLCTCEAEAERWEVVGEITFEHCSEHSVPALHFIKLTHSAPGLAWHRPNGILGCLGKDGVRAVNGTSSS